MKIDLLRCVGFRGRTIEEFTTYVEETHKNDPEYLAEYRAMIQFFKEIRAVREKILARV
jgi:hypothetical protein